MNPILAFKHKQLTLDNFVALCHVVARVVTSTGWQVLVVLIPLGCQPASMRTQGRVMRSLYSHFVVAR